MLFDEANVCKYQSKLAYMPLLRHTFCFLYMTNTLTCDSSSRQSQCGSKRILLFLFFPASCHIQPETVFPDWGVGVEEETVLLFLMFPLGRKERGKLSHVFLALRRGEFKPHLSGLTLGLKH